MDPQSLLAAMGAGGGSNPYANPEALMASMGSSGLPMPSEFLTPAKAKKQARDLSTDVLSSWETLRKILDRHEETLRKRWLKKTKEQRKKILLSVSPNMPATHRPDYEAFRKSARPKDRGKNFRASYVWPYINLEDLTQAKQLPLFLNSRARNPPYMFAHADIDAIRLGHVSGAISPAFLNEYTSYMDGVTPSSYGRIVSWDDDDGAFDAMMSGRGLHPGEGILVLEIQKGVMDFLVGCCYAILRDLDPTTMTSNQIPVSPEPPAITREATEWPSLASMAAEAPYRVPEKLDFESLKAVIAAKRSAAEDHIWALREDPGYFHDIVGDISEHRLETLLDVNGNRHPVLGGELFWARTFGNLIVDAYGALMFWDDLSRQATDLVSLRNKHSSNISPKKDLPPEYMKALLAFQHALNQVSKGPISNLKIGVPASPYFRSMFVREPQIAGSTKIITKLKSNIKPEPILWIFKTLWDDRQLFLCRLPDLMDELERLLQSNSKEREKLSSYVEAAYSDLGVVAGAMHQINLYQPWAAGMDHHSVTYEKDIQAEFAKRFAALGNLTTYISDAELLKIKLGSLSDRRFHYPSDKRRTTQHVDEMRRAEHNLDAFWETVDQHYKEKSGKSLAETFKYLLTSDRQIERTREWIPPATEPNRKPESAQEELLQGFSRLDLQQDTPTGIEMATPKTKVKTRGTPHPSTDDETNWRTRTTTDTTDSEPTLAVSKRSLKVFSTLFHTINQTEQPGEIPWPDFLHAMVSTGFGPTKLYGSVWQFTPTKLDVERSIQFHEPHPRNRIPFRMARRFGRRLNRAYGWTSSTFVLAE